MTIRPTRYSELSYTNYAGIWRFVDTETGAVVGPLYRSKAELLADMARYAKDNWGL